MPIGKCSKLFDYLVVVLLALVYIQGIQACMSDEECLIFGNDLSKSKRFF